MCPALSCAFPRSSEFIGCNLPRLSRMPRRRAVAIGVLPEADRHGREPFCALLFKCEGLPSKITNIILSRHYINLAMSVGRRFDKNDNILFSFDHWQGLT